MYDSVSKTFLTHGTWITIFEDLARHQDCASCQYLYASSLDTFHPVVNISYTQNCNGESHNSSHSCSLSVNL